MERSGSVQIITDRDPGGPKTSGHPDPELRNTAYNKTATVIDSLYLPIAERQVANKEDQERAYQELADSLSEEDRRFLQQNARKRKWKVGVKLPDELF